MEFIESIDPFLMQLFIVPLIVIGLGLLVSILAKKVFVAPLITLLLNLLYETWYMKHYYDELEISYTSWNIIFPVISLVISWGVVSVLKQKSKQN
ncbi:hypothetical protein CR203_20090 [Salipaludibacillus neizhouensis]|uniref:Uncharacterized protein n=1 Tax=Salipaludibacillus neizhouensis TaxID=885475 RepID=A0A3A9K5H9_9BACI|nr:DUF2651 family protein [Salipaludibacillus neizhouensis]RKL65621.1 hypothetical protein CR203_20090 [Salipaludibacillus neizhouensis]